MRPLGPALPRPNCVAGSRPSKTIFLKTTPCKVASPVGGPKIEEMCFSFCLNLRRLGFSQPQVVCFAPKAEIRKKSRPEGGPFIFSQPNQLLFIIIFIIFGRDLGAKPGHRVAANLERPGRVDCRFGSRIR